MDETREDEYDAMDYWESKRGYEPCVVYVDSESESESDDWIHYTLPNGRVIYPIFSGWITEEDGDLYDTVFYYLHSDDGMYQEVKDKDIPKEILEVAKKDAEKWFERQ